MSDTIDTLAPRVDALEKAQNDNTKTLRWVVSKLAGVAAVQDQQTLLIESLDAKVDALPRALAETMLEIVGASEGRLREGIAAGEVRLREEMAAGEVRLREDIAAGEGRLRDEMAAGEGRLREEMAAGEVRVRGEIVAMEDRINGKLTDILTAIAALAR